jgi:hypothetical protein
MKLFEIYEHIKNHRPIIILIVLVITFVCQICYNHQGYNYLLYTITVFIFCYLNEITYLEIGTLKIKKIQREYEKSLVAIFKMQLETSVSFSTGTFSQAMTVESGSLILSNKGDFDKFMTTVTDIEKMEVELELSTQLKKDLNESIKKCSNVLLSTCKSSIQCKHADVPEWFNIRISRLEELAKNGLKSLK